MRDVKNKNEKHENGIEEEKFVSYAKIEKQNGNVQSVCVCVS
jgi:hypothetical protein